MGHQNESDSNPRYQLAFSICFGALMLDIAYRRYLRRLQICCKYMWIIALGTITLVLLVLTIRKVDPDDRKNISDLQFVMPRLGVVGESCKVYQCSVKCVNSTNLQFDMLRAIMETGCENIETFHVDQQNFPNGNLPKLWALTNASFFEIIITNSNLNYIEPEAFDSDDFSQTFSLSLENIPLTWLDGAALLGLPRLESLTIDAPVSHISRVFFQPIRATLKTLKLKHMGAAIQFNDLFGVCNMSQLVDLDLSNNQFVEPITILGFQRLTKIRYLDLSNSQISAIGKNAFDPIKETLKFLDLSHNNLTTLGFDTLDNILVSRRAYIYLRENNWVCDCDLIPLVDYYNLYSEVFLDLPICRAPQEFYGAAINTVSLCEYLPTFPTAEPSEGAQFSASDAVDSTEKVRSSDHDTTKGSSTAAPTLDSSYATVPCLTTPKAGQKKDAGGIIQSINLQPSRRDFSIKYLGDLTVVVEIVEYEDEITILWYSDPDAYSMQTVGNDDCSRPTNGTFMIRNLIENSSYAFCLIPKGKITITPFNCLPYYIPPKVVETCDAWLTLENKDLALILTSIVIVVSFVLGAFATYLLVRNFPEIIRGSNRVLVLNKIREERRPKVSIISANVEKKSPKRFAPPPPYNIFPEEDSSYEIPIEVVENEYLDEFQRCYAEPSHVNEDTPEIPPPLPKRNSTQIYSSTITRDAYTKRSF